MENNNEAVSVYNALITLNEERNAAKNAIYASGAIVNLIDSLKNVELFLEKYTNCKKTLTSNKVLSSKIKKVIVREYKSDLNSLKQNIASPKVLSDLASIIENSKLKENSVVENFLADSKYKIALYVKHVGDYKKVFNDLAKQ